MMDFRKILLLLSLILSVLVCYPQKNARKSDKKASAEKPFDFNFSFYFLEGNKNKNLGDYDAAIRNYTRALTIDNTQPAAYYEIATILFASGDYQAAQTYAEKAVQYDKTNNIAYIDMLIYTYQYSNQNEKTIPLYRKLIASNPNDIENYYELAKVYQTLNKPKDAIKVLDEAEKQVGITDIISVQKEMMYEKMGNMNKSFEEMKRLRDAYPTNLRYKAMLAEAYFQNKKFDLAKTEFSELEKMNIDEGLVYLSLAEYHRATDAQYYNYFAMLEKAFNCDDESLTYELKMQILNQLLPIARTDDYIKVQIKRLTSIVEKQYPSDIALIALKADIAMMNNDYKSVQQNLSDIVAEDKSSFEIWEHLMNIDYHLQDYDKLYEHSKEASELFPNVLSVYQFYVVAAYLKKEFREVVEAVDYASMLSVDNQQVMIDLLSMQGDAYHALKEYHKADSVYEYILFKDGDFESVLNNYSYNLAVRGEKLDKALEMSTHLIELNPSSPTFIDTHAWVLYKNGELDEALKYMNDAIAKDNSNAVYYDHRGDIQFKLGKKDEALSDWKKALELDPENKSLENKIRNKSLTE
ncbi:MAG: tetratricopeptide repeat protein [Bacteroidales bacterium]|nr:tetratricopeptide repeat protein [Bacteroidales bacterium]